MAPFTGGLLVRVHVRPPSSEVAVSAKSFEAKSPPPRMPCEGSRKATEIPPAVGELTSGVSYDAQVSPPSLVAKIRATILHLADTFNPSSPKVVQLCKRGAIMIGCSNRDIIRESHDTGPGRFRDYVGCSGRANGVRFLRAFPVPLIAVPLVGQNIFHQCDE